MYWLDALGVMNRVITNPEELRGVRKLPSFQLVGRQDNRNLDLASLQSLGVQIVGRCLSSNETRVRFADDLAASTGQADARLRRLLRRIDALVDARGDRAPTHEGVAGPLELTDTPTSLDLSACDRQ